MGKDYGVIYWTWKDISYQQFNNWTFQPYVALFELY